MLGFCLISRTANQFSDYTQVLLAQIPCAFWDDVLSLSLSLWNVFIS